jgi:hypothetical protein
MVDYIYIVVTGDYEEYRTLGVFTDLDSADAFMFSLDPSMANTYMQRWVANEAVEEYEPFFKSLENPSGSPSSSRAEVYYR